MKILHVYKDYHPVMGGIENHIKHLAEAQAMAGHQVTVLVCDPGRKTHYETLNRVRVIKAGRLLTAASMPFSLAQPWLLARCRPDIVHLQSPYPLGEASNWLLGRGRATVISYQSDIIRPSQQRFLPIYGPILRRVLRSADRILASSPNYIASSPWLKSVADRCTVVPLGIDVTRFTPGPPRTNSTPTLLFVGRLRYYKGLDTLLQALPRVPPVRLNIVGDGPLRQTLAALTTSLGLTDRVNFAGDIADDQLPDWYRQADIFVLPANARAEAYGLVLLEAMASGLPCVTTELGTGTSWIVQHGQTGLVVPPQDPATLAAALTSLLADEALRQHFGQAARKRVLEEFHKDLMVERVLQVYDEVL